MIYRQLAQEPYGMSFRDIDELTFYQVRFLLVDEKDIKADVETRTESAIKSIKQKFADAKLVAIRNLLEGKLWHSM